VLRTRRLTALLPLYLALAHTPLHDGSGNLRLLLWRSGGPRRTQAVSTSTRGRYAGCVVSMGFARLWT